MILVTGGSGMTGTHLLLQLSREGKKVRALKRKTSYTRWVRRIFDYYEPEKGGDLYSRIEWVNGDITNRDTLEPAFAGIDTVYHTAGYVSFDPAENRKLLQVNVEGTRNMVELSLETGVEKFCHVSSVAALGRHLQGEESWVSENDYRKVKKERYGYGFSKLLGEMEVWRGMEEGLQAVILNPAIILGPGNWSRGSASLFKTIRKGNPFYSPGSSGYVDVRDVAEIMVRLTEQNIFGERFILCAENLSFRQLFSMIAGEFGIKSPSRKAGKGLMTLAAMADRMISRLTGHPHQLTRDTVRAGNSRIFYSAEKIRKILNYPFIPVKEAVRNAVRFYKNSEAKV